MTALLMVFALLNPTGNNLMGDQAVVHRGAQFTVTEQITLDDIAKTPEKFAGKTVKVAAKVTNVCRRKGCWMSVAGSTAHARARVAFKDYAFFAPFDSTGKLAIIEGTVKVKAMSEAERKHLAADAGRPVSEIPKAELRLIASALEIRKIGH